MGQKRAQKSICGEFHSTIEVNLGLILVLVKDMGIIYGTKEPDFEIWIFLEFYGHLKVEFWPFSRFLPQIHHFHANKIPKNIKFKNPAL